jgi:ketosteroid isomerase-like protein
MNAEASVTETVVRNHLEAFLKQKGVAAIVADYDEDARLFTDQMMYHGKQDIYCFFVNFIASLPPGAIEHFTLRSLLVDRNVGYITWSVGNDIPLGTDTFVVTNGKIVSQTFAMHLVAAQ